MKHYPLLLLCVLAFVACGQVTLNDSGTRASFSKGEDGGWSITFKSSNGMVSNCDMPVSIVLYSGTEAVPYYSPYSSVTKNGGKVTATASISAGDVSFVINDSWTLDDGMLNLDRNVKVQGGRDADGFYSSIAFFLDPSMNWDNSKPILSGIIYGEPHTSATSKGGSRYNDARFFSVREDCFSAPAVTMADAENRWISFIDPDPDGSTTWTESCASAQDVIIESEQGFGAFEIRDNGGALRMSFNFPGTIEEFPGRGFGAPAVQSAESIMRWRLHPVSDGFEQNYRLTLCAGKAESFPDAQKQSWRTAWQLLNPEVETVDVDLVRTDLINHLSDRVISYEGRAGIPFVIDAQSGKPGSFRPRANAFRMGTNHPDLEPNVKWARQLGIDIDPNAAELDIWPYAVFGFCGKHIEIAQQFYREADRDNTERGAKLRAQADAIMKTFVDNFPLDPPVGEGISLRTGRVGNIHGGSSFSLRPIGEDLSTLLDLLDQEEASGREHPDWLEWCRSFADWLLPFQRSDGSFPSDWVDGEITEQVGSKTYGVVSMYAKLGRRTGEQKYTDAALAAAEFMWQTYGTKAVYLGATGGVDVADKESGMLNMDAFLTLYELNGDSKWLDRACAAADYTESWIWIWNVPMPTGVDADELGWKPGVCTIGVNGIGSNDVGGVDQYLDWAVPHYAKLYKYTGDEHYLDVARVLLHGTKAMLAITGRTYDLAGPGWQQEHWRMSQTRGIGGHRTWLPWISINHLHGITALEDFDKELYLSLSE